MTGDWEIFARGVAVGFFVGIVFVSWLRIVMSRKRAAE